ncbi:MAG: LpxL/LpxP family Kdo(2)-lipid IV(A) lauroyl/palmitoleoyl acyltransferase [Gammaproteobacteria bacterium]|nr:LpxL/LpxP family Kdo(2)-lipid IV(A) lauroyl/palmitoleoyl acyltransferase [Gammaproteobacteria bacterium]
MDEEPTPSLFAPKQWPVWIVLGILWLIAVLVPYGMAKTIGKGMGWLVYKLAKRRRIITRVNLDICFPELTPEQRETLTREHFEAMGIALIMTGFSWWASDRKLAPLYHPEGREQLEAELKKGKGAILLGHHFTDMEIVGRMAAKYTPISVIYRQHENPVIEWASRKSREKRFAGAISHHDMRAMIRTLKRGGAVWYAPDQAYRGPNSTIVPFFGEPASTHTGTSALARISKSPVIMVYGHRQPDNNGYRVIAKPPLKEFPTKDATADAARINREYEAIIREAPEQYFWSHRRFKKRDGMADPY